MLEGLWLLARLHELNLNICFAGHIGQGMHSKMILFLRRGDLTVIRGGQKTGTCHCY